MALLCTALLSQALTEYFPLSAADFDHYCGLVGRVAEGNLQSEPGVRMPAPAWLPAAASHSLGLIDGLALQSFLALVATCAGLYLWGLTLRGRLAGTLAALLAGTIGPLAFLARDLSFYPVVVAGSVVLAAAVVASVRFRGVGPSALAGVAAAVLLLADVRGVLFAAPLVGVGLAFAVLRARRWPAALLRVGLLAAPVVASWFIAHAVVPAQLTGLEAQAVMYADQALRNAGESPDLLAREQAATRHSPGFVWGHASPTALPGAFLFLGRLTDRVPPAARDSQQNVELRARHLVPWAAPGLIALAICLVGLARKPWRLVALGLCAAPFLGMLWATGQVLPQERHLATGLAVLPVLLGVAAAVLAEATPPVDAGSARPPGVLSWRQALLVGAIAAAMLGLPPSWLDYQAGWRKGIVQSEPRTLLQRVKDHRSIPSNPCTRALGQGVADPWWPSRLYPRARRVLDGSDTWAPD
mgnify:FL=1